MKKILFLSLVFVLPIRADLPPELKKNRKAGTASPSRLAKLGDDGPDATFFNINRWLYLHLYGIGKIFF